MLIGFYRYFRSDFLYPFIYSSTPVAQQKLNGEWNFWPRPQLFSYKGSQRMLIIICGGRLYIPDVWFLADMFCLKKQVHILVFYFLLYTFLTVCLARCSTYLNLNNIQGPKQIQLYSSSNFGNMWKVSRNIFRLFVKLTWMQKIFQGLFQRLNSFYMRLKCTQNISMGY